MGMTAEQRQQLEEILGYEFKNPELLEQALTRASAISAGIYQLTRNFEPLEFDASK